MGQQSLGPGLGVLRFAAFVWFDGIVRRRRRRRRRMAAAPVLVAMVLVAMVLVGAACGGDGESSDGASGDQRDRPRALEFPTALVGPTEPIAIRIDADTSTDDGPFPTFDDDVGFGGYDDLVYRFGVYEPDATTVVGYGVDDYGTGTSIYAWFDSTTAPADTGFGVVCRLQDEGETYYRFGVGNDGTYSIALVEGDDTTILTGDGEWATSELIDPTTRSFIVEASCTGNELTLAVNNELIDSVTDDYLISGNVGVFAKTFDEPDASVDLSVFDVSGFLEPDLVGPDVAAAFDDLFGSRPREIDRCELGDVREMGLRTEPLLVAFCDGIMYAYTDRRGDAKRIYEQIVDQTGADELATAERFPDCTRRTGVEGPFGLHSGAGEIACLEIEGETVVIWYHRGGFVGALRVDPEAADEFQTEWAADWWPLQMEMKPG